MEFREMWGEEMFGLFVRMLCSDMNAHQIGRLFELPASVVSLHRLTLTRQVRLPASASFQETP